MPISLQAMGTFVGVLAVLSAIADLMPNSPFRLKDLNTPEEDMASHSEVFSLLFGGDKPDNSNESK
jgi:hypothetical protein